MKRNDFEQLILSELRELRKDMSEVRTNDIPGIKTHVASFDGKMATLEKEQTRSTRLYTVIGTALAVVLSKFTGHA